MDSYDLANAKIFFVRIFQCLRDHGNFEVLAGISPPQAVPLSWLVLEDYRKLIYFN